MPHKTVGKWFEILFPWICAALVSGSVYFLDYSAYLLPGAKDRVLDKMVDVCAIGIGFWATAATLLLALEDRSTVRGLKELGTYTRIVGYFLSTIYTLVFLLALSMFSLAMGRPNWFRPRLYWGMWLFVMTLSATSMLRAFWLLGKLLKSK
jgi:hypothetical protein